jgi:hypothetical protein
MLTQTRPGRGRGWVSVTIGELALVVIALVLVWAKLDGWG